MDLFSFLSLLPPYIYLFAGGLAVEQVVSCWLSWGGYWWYTYITDYIHPAWWYGIYRLIAEAPNVRMLGPDITLEPILRVYRISTRTYHLLCVLVFFFLFLSLSCCPCCWFGFARRPRSWWFSFTTCFQSLAEDDRRWNKWGRTAASPIRRAISHRCAFNAKGRFSFSLSCHLQFNIGDFHLWSAAGFI